MAFKKVVKETPVVQQEDGVLLELSLYNRYNRHGKHYEKGTGNQPIVYRFTKDAAVILLGEVDNGRPVWRVHKVKTAVDRKSTRLNSSHRCISYADFCLTNKKTADRGADQVTGGSARGELHRSEEHT